MMVAQDATGEQLRQHVSLSQPGAGACIYLPDLYAFSSTSPELLGFDAAAQPCAHMLCRRLAAEQGQTDATGAADCV